MSEAVRHYHPCYKDWHCGASIDEAIWTSNAKDVNCPVCRENAAKEGEQSMNDASLFTAQLQDFVKRHGISDDLSSRAIKLREEVNELINAIADDDSREIAKEAADVAIIAFHILIILNYSPVLTMCLKLKEVASRPHYQEIARKVAEGKR